MSVESGRTISQLDKTWPRSDDTVSEGDNHLRLIKAVLKTQFPGANGNGYDTIIDATESELNQLVGLTENVQEAFDAIRVEWGHFKTNLNAPTETHLAFHAALVPPGWTTQNYGNDYMLRIIDPSIHSEGPGGFQSPVQYYSGHTHETEGHSLTEEELPEHSHTISPLSTSHETGYTHLSLTESNGPDGGGDSGITGEGNPHDHGTTGFGGQDWFPRYITAVVGKRDPYD